MRGISTAGADSAGSCRLREPGKLFFRRVGHGMDDTAGDTTRQSHDLVKPVRSKVARRISLCAGGFIR